MSPPTRAWPGASRSQRRSPRAGRLHPPQSLLAIITVVAGVAGCAPGASVTAPAGTPTATASASGALPGSATPVPATASGSRPHILVVMEENDGYALTLGRCGSGSPDPYLCSLAADYASATNWYGVEHPSLPNYLDIISGSDQGCTGDGCLGPFSASNLGAQLTTAAIPWVADMESMPSACYTGVSAGDYARKHDPFMDFTDVAQAADCSRVVRPYPGGGGIAAALDEAGAPDFAWVTPNLSDDMHDGTIQAADTWLRDNLTPVLDSAWFADRGTVIVTMDENDGQGGHGCCADPGGGQIPEVVISAASRGRGAVTVTGDHFGTLRTIEEAYGLPLLGAARDSAHGDLSSLLG